MQQAPAEASGGPAELDLATTLASFPPEVREEVLMTADEEMLAQLPPAILAEAQALRTHAMRPPRTSHTAVRSGPPPRVPFNAQRVEREHAFRFWCFPGLLIDDTM